MQAAPTDYHSPCGDLELKRYPLRDREPLQAWCSADTLLLQAMREGHPHALARDLLVVNDTQGALSLALQPRALWTDSWMSRLALRANERRNGAPPCTVIPSTDTPPRVAGPVVLRVPRQQAYLEYQLALLARVLPPGAHLLAAGMDKHLPPATAALLERYVGPVTRHRGQHKARLFSAVRADRQAPAPPAEARWPCPPLAAEICVKPNVFSREGLDPGSRLLLQQLPGLAAATRVVDLACGSGVLGLAALHHRIATEVLFLDESALAVASARENAAALGYSACAFNQGDGLLDCPWPGADLILCNPPFHLEQAVDEFAGRRLLAQCSDFLAPGGRLCLVANRHLAYRPLLGRKFRQVRELASNRKFRVLLCEH